MSFQGEQHSGVVDTPPQTQGFRLNHTMLRVKDPERALAFYSKVFGMQVLRRLDFEEMQFSLYFLANLEPSDNVPEETEARTVWTFSQKGLLELTHNWGTENQEDFAYHDGNAEPQGFGHICFNVPDLATAQASTTLPSSSAPTRARCKMLSSLKTRMVIGSKWSKRT
ncbi:Lactoylglutathione lyase [Halomonas sp. KO116]|nr:Lactoylglutathione lyase [Halomonas sp. KO116]